MHPHLSEPLCASKKYFCSDNSKIQIYEIHRKIYYKEFYYNMNIIKMFMNNIIILLLAVRIYEDSDKQGYTVVKVRPHPIQRLICHFQNGEGVCMFLTSINSSTDWHSC